jgi:hypothetical protein
MSSHGAPTKQGHEDRRSDVDGVDITTHPIHRPLLPDYRGVAHLEIDPIRANAR